MQQEILAEAARHNVAKRERDPICEVCGHCHVQGVKCKVCGHVGKYIVPGGPNRPNRGAIPPVPPGPMHNPNRTPPTIEGLTVGSFQQALQSFFDVLPQAEAAGQSLPPELSNLDQLRARAARARAYRVWVHRPHTHLSRHRPLPQVLLDTLPDYHLEDEQPSYVLAIECRPVVCALARLMPGATAWQHVNWRALESQPGIMM